MITTENYTTTESNVKAFDSIVKTIKGIVREYGQCKLNVKDALDEFKDIEFVKCLIECLTEYEHMTVTIENRNCMFDINDISQKDTLIFTPTHEKNGLMVAGTIFVKSEMSPTSNFLHQDEALEAINKWVQKRNRYNAGIVAIPTAGGKTRVAVEACLKYGIDKNRKVLWLANRYDQLEQALESVNKNSYANLVKNKNSFIYRIVSGIHDKMKHVTKYDDMIIASRNSTLRGLTYLTSNWITNDDELIIVIDECHHAPCLTYQRIINNLKLRVKKLKVLGITATPFRSNKKENIGLKKFFTDDILYKTDMTTLIIRGILPKPKFYSYSTSDCDTDLLDI